MPTSWQRSSRNNVTCTEIGVFLADMTWLIRPENLTGLVGCFMDTCLHHCQQRTSIPQNLGFECFQIGIASVKLRMVVVLNQQAVLSILGRDQRWGSSVQQPEHDLHRCSNCVGDTSARGQSERCTHAVDSFCFGILVVKLHGLMSGSELEAKTIICFPFMSASLH